MGRLISNGVDYTGGTAAILDVLNSDQTGAALSANMGSKLASDLGTFESGNLAAYAHAQGEYFMWKGQFVKVTAAIAVGDTIATGTNVAATTISAVLSELNSKTKGNLATYASYTYVATQTTQTLFQSLRSEGIGKLQFLESSTGNKPSDLPNTFQSGWIIAAGIALSNDSGWWIVSQNTIAYLYTVAGSNGSWVRLA